MKIFQQPKIVAILLTVVWIFAPCRPSMGQSCPSKIRLWVDYWPSQADASWRTSFNRLSDNGQIDHFASRLKYNNLDADLISLKIELLPYTPLWGLNFFFTLAAPINKGLVTDTDYKNNDKYLESKNATDGRVDLWNLEGQILLYPQSFLTLGRRHKEPRLSGQCYVIFGFQHYQDNLRMFYDENSLLEPPSTQSSQKDNPLRGLNSHYTFSWEAIKIGLKSSCKLTNSSIPLFYSVEIKEKVSYLFALYHGEGIWNLRRDFAQNPSFKHKAYGYGLDAALSLAYHPWSTVGLELGWRYLNLRAGNGTSITNFSSGQKGKIDLDEVKLLRDGWFIRAAISF